MKKNEIIYCIPGLGLDHRVFSKLEIEGATLKFLDWLEPNDDENISSYSRRMAAQITDEKFSLLGHSLGGMVSIEISRIKKVQRLFLISTVKNKSEIPKIVKWLDKVPAKNSSAAKFAIEASIALKPYYDKTDKDGLKLFQEMAKDASLTFINWGIREVAHWAFEEPIKVPYTHIHGTEDLIFPIKNIDYAFTLRGATHYAIYNDADKISKIISEIILKKP